MTVLNSVTVEAFQVTAEIICKVRLQGQQQAICFRSSCYQLLPCVAQVVHLLQVFPVHWQLISCYNIESLLSTVYQQICLKFILFIYGLLNGIASGSDYITLNSKVINEQEIDNNVKGSTRT
jgi:hypothetical protein